MADQINKAVRLAPFDGATCWCAASIDPIGLKTREGEFPAVTADLDRVSPKGESGLLLMEARNRRRLLALGRDRARERGPRLGPASLPMEAIERLIQHYRDIALIERLRAERARRLNVSRPIGDRRRGRRRHATGATALAWSGPSE